MDYKDVLETIVREMLFILETAEDGTLRIEAAKILLQMIEEGRMALLANRRFFVSQQRFGDNSPLCCKTYRIHRSGSARGEGN